MDENVSVFECIRTVFQGFVALTIEAVYVRDEDDPDAIVEPYYRYTHESYSTINREWERDYAECDTFEECLTRYNRELSHYIGVDLAFNH